MKSAEKSFVDRVFDSLAFVLRFFFFSGILARASWKDFFPFVNSVEVKKNSLLLPNYQRAKVKNETSLSVTKFFLCVKI